MSGGNKKSSFKYVFIPCDANEPIQELTLEFKLTEAIECLTQKLQKHFQQAEGSKTNAQKSAHEKAMREQLLSQMTKNNPDQTPIDENLISMLTSMVTVDTHPLQLNTKATDFIAVHMYVDDQGMLKQLPTNVRASGICAAAGAPITVHGDAFIARTFDNDHDFTRLDFTLKELSDKDTEFFKSARNANLQRGKSSANLENLQQMLSTGKVPASAINSSIVSNKPNDLTEHKCSNGRVCQNKGTLRCSKCKAIYYCSAECQKKDWSVHKSQCKKV